MDNLEDQTEPVSDPFDAESDLESRLGNLEMDGYRTVFVSKVALLPVQLEAGPSSKPMMNRSSGGNTDG